MGAPMTVGVMRVVLHLPESGSLKSKRQVISGLLRRVRQELHVAAAEVGEPDRWQLAELAITCVSGDARLPDAMLAPAPPFFERHSDGPQLTDRTTELPRLCKSLRD